MEPLLIAARTLHFAATISLAGVFAFECLVAVPVFASANASAGLPVRLERRLTGLAWGSLLLALASGAAWLAGTAANMAGQGLNAALSRGVWIVVLTHTQFGQDWLLRLACAALIALCLLLRQRRSRGARWAALPFAAAMLAGLAWAGHGAATTGAPGDLHLAADVLHLLGAGGWLGTLIPFALLLAEVRGADASGARLAGAAARRFSTLASISVALLLAGGIVNTWFLAGSLPALFGTGYGRLLLAKIALFLATLVIAAVNLLRLTPRLADAAGKTVIWLRRNATAEAGLGVAVLAIVGVLGTLPPGAHSEPGWPFPVRIEVAGLTLFAKILLVFLLVAFCGCAVALVASAAAGRYRRAAILAGALVVCLGAGWLLLRPTVEPAYPTSFYAPAEPYDAGSIVRGAALYAANCALCHGTSGRGDGPAAAGLPARPADLTEAHLFGHSPGDLFWWVSNGRANGAMPGFASVMQPNERWDVINFIRARAAGMLSRRLGPQITTAAAPAIPDFAFERKGAQETLSRLLARGPVLLVLFVPPAPAARLAALAGAQPPLAEAGLRVVAVAPGPPNDERKPVTASEAPFVVAVSLDVQAALALFRGPNEGAETELLLDRGGAVRARWTAGGAAGLPDDATLVADARRAAQIAVAAPSHAGHAR